MKTIAELAVILGARVEGDESQTIRAIRPLSQAADGELAFLRSGTEPPATADIRAMAVIVKVDTDRSLFPDATTLLRVADPDVGFQQALHELYPDPGPPFTGIAPGAQIADGVEVGADVAIGHGVVVEEGSRLGARVVLYPGVYVGASCTIGDDTILYPQVSLYRNTSIGNRGIIHSGSVIGCDGFGFVPAAEGARKIRHIGGVRIGNDVEIGANCTIDRGVLEDSEIGDGCKLDNGIHLGHNVTLGRHCLLAAHCAIAGSTRIGQGVMLGGQVGAAGHITVGDRAQVAGRSGITHSLAADGKYFGLPASEIRHALRANAVHQMLPEMLERIRELEKRLEERPSER